MRPVLVSLLLAALSGCASVHHVLISQPRPAIDPAQVKVYQVPPKHYVEIARLDARSGAGFGTQGQINATINRLANEAAKLGANGVILLGVDSGQSPVSVGVGGAHYGGHTGVSLGMGIPTTQEHAEGIAIYVTEE